MSSTTSPQTPSQRQLSKHNPARDKIDVIFVPSLSTGIFPCTIGRAGHVNISRPNTANFQRNFQIHQDAGEIMLVDNSPAKNCQFFECQDTGSLFDGSNARQFREGLSSRVAVIDPVINTTFSSGGRDAFWYRWAIKWHVSPPLDTFEWIAMMEISGVGLIGRSETFENLPLARRKYYGLSEDRFLDSGLIFPKLDKVVTKAVDVYPGPCVAIKTVKVQSRFKDIMALGNKAEEICTDLNHPQIIEFLQGEILQNEYKLVMELQGGTRTQLTREDPHDRRSTDPLIRPLLHQICEDEIGLHYRLALFDIATLSSDDQMVAGTLPFMAPEVSLLTTATGQPHTPKIDIWSIWATLSWTFNIGTAAAPEDFASFFQISFLRIRSIER
ncbi:hypothetical protein DER45DRAFT_614291 [Fusarium avenaceum]|nr:hypothetical protein DER45DRAFT_614291 [Fusarium avenaceum]